MSEQTNALNDNFKAAHVKLNVGERLNYTVGEIGYNGIMYWVNAFLMIYYTDTIGIPIATISILLFATRIFDAVNDPFIGTLADRTKTRWGRYRPWIFVSSIAMALSIILLFSANPEWGATTKIVYMCVFYIVFTVASTGVNMPYGSLNSVITTDSEERVRMGGWRIVLGTAGNNGLALIAIPLLTFFSAKGGETTAGGYQKTVMLTCAVLVIPLIWTAVKVKERVQPPLEQRANTKIPVKKLFASLFKNQPMIMVILGMVINGYVMYGIFSVQMYYFTYVAGDVGLLSIYGLVNGIPMMLGAYFTGWFYKMTKHKGRSITIARTFVGIAYILIFFFPAPSKVFWVLIGLVAFGQGVAIGTMYGLIPDAIDYGEYKSGVRYDGFLYATTSFALKVGSAIGPTIGGMMLAASNYVPNAVQQSPEALTTMNILISILPGVLSLSIAVLFLFYKIDAKRHDEIRMELERRRSL